MDVIFDDVRTRIWDSAETFETNSAVSFGRGAVVGGTGGKQRTERCQVATELPFRLHQNDGMSETHRRDGCLHTGTASADYHDRLIHLLVQGLIDDRLLDANHTHADEVLRQHPGVLFPCGVGPCDLFTQAHPIESLVVALEDLEGFPLGSLGASGDDDAVEGMLRNGITDRLDPFLLTEAGMS